MIVGEQRVRRARVRHRQLAARIHVAEQHVRDRRAPFQPRIEPEDDRLRRVGDRLNDARPPLDEHEHDRFAGGQDRAREPELRVRQREVVDVARGFRVRLLAEAQHDDVRLTRGGGRGGDVELLVVGRARHVGDVRRARGDRAAHGRAILRIRRVAVALPGERPAVVERRLRIGGRTGHEQTRRPGERQHAVGVLQQHDGLARRLERLRARRRRSDLGARLGSAARVVEQSETRLHRQNARDRVVDP